MNRKTAAGPDGGCVAADALIAFANGTLDASGIAGVTEHLVQCVDCRVVLAEVARRENQPGTACATSLVPGMSLGRYVLGACVGVGGMGVVYEADDPRLGRRVALKVLHGARADQAAWTRRFLREQQILASLGHPNIARLFDGGQTADGRDFLVMEFVDGLPLDRYCEEHRLSTRARLVLFRQVCAAVHYAHQQQVVHRDLKPSNILVTPAGVPKLVDFGIAKLLEADPVSSALTASGLQPMTPAFAAPEQVNLQPITPATDVYSLGVVLYRLLCGRSPYRLTTAGLDEVFHAIRAQEPEVPSKAAPHPVRGELGADLDSVVLMALRKSPRDRYGSADLLSEDLRRVLERLPTRARRGTPLYLAAMFGRRHKVTVGALALVVAAVIASRWRVATWPGAGPTAAVEPGDATVTEVPALSEGMHEAAATWDGQRVLLFGGLTDSGEFSDAIRSVDPATDVVTRRPEVLPFGREASSAVWTGQHALIFGGRTASFVTDQIVRFTPATGAVTALGAKLPTSLYNMAAVWTGEAILLFGGFDGRTMVREVVRYAPDADVASSEPASLPVGREGAAAVWDGRYAWILGGSDGRLASRDVIRYDPSSHQVTVLPIQLPIPLWDAGVVWDGQHAYLIGGLSNAGGVAMGRSTAIIRFTPATQKIELLLTTLPRPRTGRTAAWAGDRGYVVGGYDLADDRFLTTMIRFQP